MEEKTVKVNKAENAKALKDLKHYSKSDSYKEFVEYCRDMKDGLDKKIDSLIFKRVSGNEIRMVGSYITEKCNTVGILELMKEKTENKIFKEWFSERIRREKSAIYNSPTLEELNYSDLDLLKSKRRDYYGGQEHMLNFCISIYEEQKEVDYFDQRNPYTF